MWKLYLNFKYENQFIIILFISIFHQLIFVHAVLSKQLCTDCRQKAEATLFRVDDYLFPELSWQFKESFLFENLVDTDNYSPKNSCLLQILLNRYIIMQVSSALGESPGMYYFKKDSSHNLLLEFVEVSSKSKPWSTTKLTILNSKYSITNTCISL